MSTLENGGQDRPHADTVVDQQVTGDSTPILVLPMFQGFCVMLMLVEAE